MRRLLEGGAVADELLQDPACGKQHSLLAGTIFEQTKTGLARGSSRSTW